MHTIPPTYKKLLFNKEAHEPLTDPEQETWEEVLMRIQPPQKEVNIDDPAFIEAMKLHYALKDRKKAAWEKFKQEVLPNYIDTDPAVVEIQVKTSTFRIPRWGYAAAAVIIVTGVGFWWDNFNRAVANPPVYLTQGAGYKELCTVKLPDGSTVTLNSLSTVRYPDKFTSEERNVELTGEAYFTVASDTRHPFRVSASEADIIATGTEFNVKAYKEDATVKATLKTGVIRVKKGDSSKIIDKGDQAVVAGKQITINKKVNMSSVLAWQHKVINFEGETLFSIMQQIQRFYKIGYIIQGNPPALDIASTANLATTNSLETILLTLRTVVPEADFMIDKDSSIITVNIKE